MRNLFGGDPYFNNVALQLPLRSHLRDESKTAKAVTIYGDTNIISDAAYFDGTGDYLGLSAHDSLVLGTADFTFECFANFSSVSGFRVLIAQRNTASSEHAISVYWASATGSLEFVYSGNGTTYTTAQFNWSPQTATWYHIAFVRYGTNLQCFVDGKQIGTTHNIGTTNIYSSSAEFKIGAADATPSSLFQGYIKDLRITKGLVRYKSNFTIPLMLPASHGVSRISHVTPITLPDAKRPPIIKKYNKTNNITYSNNISLQLPFFNSLNDESVNPRTATVSGSPKIDNEAAYFNGSTDYIQYAKNPSLNLGTGDFTIEFWFNYPGSAIGYPTVICTGQPGWTAGGCNIVVDGSGAVDKVVMSYFTGGLNFATNTTIQYNTWNHIAYVRRSGKLYAYYNGKYENSWDFTDSLDFTNGDAYNIFIGTSAHQTVQCYTGYIKNLRIIKGIGIYNSNFTPDWNLPSNYTSSKNIFTYNKIDSRKPPVLINPIPTVDGDKYFQHVLVHMPLTGPEWSNYGLTTEAVAAYGDVKIHGDGTYFDGSDDYLQFTDVGTDFQPTTEDLTLELECKPDAASLAAGLYTLCGRARSTGGEAILILRISSGVFAAVNYKSTNAYDTITSTTALEAGKWYHVAFVKRGVWAGLFVNGKLEGTSSFAAFDLNDAGHQFSIGRLGTYAGQYFAGYIRNVRLTRGVARYWSNFTPPTSLPTHGVAAAYGIK